jgi:hypothetical protein
MMEAIRDRLAVAAGATAFIAILLILLPAFDLMATLWPVRPGDLHWRFGASGLMAGFLLTPLLGLMLLTLVATLSDRRSTYLTLAVVNGVGTVALGAVLVLFLLDVLQLRGTVPAAQQTSFDAAALKALVKYAACGCALIALTLANVRLWRVAARRSRRAAARVVVGPPVSASEPAAPASFVLGG